MKKVVLIIISIVVSLGFVDAYYFLHQNSPLFTFHTVNQKDGGTIFRYGVGYQLVEWNVLSQDEQKQPFLLQKKRSLYVSLFCR